MLALASTTTTVTVPLRPCCRNWGLASTTVASKAARICRRSSQEKRNRWNRAFARTSSSRSGQRNKAGTTMRRRRIRRK
jgi:hypothetical protein